MSKILRLSAHQSLLGKCTGRGLPRLARGPSRASFSQKFNVFACHSEGGFQPRNLLLLRSQRQGTVSTLPRRAPKNCHPERSRGTCFSLFALRYCAFSIPLL